MWPFSKVLLTLQRLENEEEDRERQGDAIFLDEIELIFDRKKWTDFGAKNKDAFRLEGLRVTFLSNGE